MKTESNECLISFGAEYFRWASEVLVGAMAIRPTYVTMHKLRLLYTLIVISGMFEIVLVASSCPHVLTQEGRTVSYHLVRMVTALMLQVTRRGRGIRTGPLAS